MGILKTTECRLLSFITIKAPEKLKTGPLETPVQTLIDEKEASVQLHVWKTDFSISMPKTEIKKNEKVDGKDDRRWQRVMGQKHICFVYLSDQISTLGEWFNPWL